MSIRPSGGKGSFFIVDANNFLFRAYHGLPMLTAPDGTPVNAVHGYVRMIQALRKEFEPEYLIAIFDHPDDDWRHALYPAYKANRPPPPEDLVPQKPLVRQATAALAVPWVEVEGVEADDVIAAYAHHAADRELEVVVCSSDKDLMQLVEEETEGRKPIRMWDTMKARLIGPERVREKYGVGPELLGDLLALAGDSSDNVPGVPGIGAKTAAQLLDTFGDLESVLRRAPEIKQKKRRERLIEHAEDARLSRQLVALRADLVDLPKPLDELRDPGPDRETMDAFFVPLGFKSALTGSVTSAGGGGRGRGRRSGSTGVVDLGDLLERKQGVVIDPARYRALRRTDRDTLVAMLESLERAKKFAFHVELSHAEPMRADIVGVALAGGDPEHPPSYVPLGHRSLTDAPATQLSVEEALELLRPLLEDPEVHKLAHAHKSQCVVLARHGIEVAGMRIDPMLASYALDPARTSHAVEDLAEDLLGHKAIPRSRVVGKGKKQAPFDQVSIDEATPYCAERSELAWLLGEHLDMLVEKAGEASEKLVFDLEMPLAQVLWRLERRGVLLDAAVFHEQGKAMAEELRTIEAEIQAEAGYAINPESNQQLQRLLFEDRKLPAKKRTKTGYSVDAQVLEELAQLDPIVRPILKHRRLTKLKGTYLDTFPELINPKTGRLHTQFRQAVAQTGRLSSTDPNLQNIPIRRDEGRRIRRGFVAPEGMSLVALDYSQIELRVLAHLSQDPNLSSAFNDRADVHRRTASEVFEVTEEEVTADQRRIAKAVNFGVIYGQGPWGLAQTLGIPQGRAGRYIKSYFKKIPGVKRYMEELIEIAKRRGYAETILGRRRRIPELAQRGQAARNYGERIARNTPIQGSAADILKLAMIRVERELESIGWARMLLTVHDELIFECEDAQVDALVALVRPVMEGAVELSVPLEVDAGIGKNWEQAKG